MLKSEWGRKGGGRRGRWREGSGGRQRSRDAEMKMGNFIFFSPENMMNGDMRKAHYVHDDEKKNAFGCFNGMTCKRRKKI